jgi:hypothetical protein
MQTLLSPRLAEDPVHEHEFRIERTQTHITAYMDSTKIFTAPWDTYFGNDEHIYLRVASEVLSGGDTVSGTVRNIELKTPNGTKRPYLPTIADEDRGVVFVCKNRKFVATGTFNSKKLTEPRWFRPSPCENK